MNRFMEQLPELFSIDDIEQITKLVITNIANEDSDVSKKASTLFVLMKRKFNQSILIQPTIDFIDSKNSDNLLVVCLEIVNILLEGSVDIFSKEFCLSNIIEKFSNILTEKQRNKEISTKIMNLYELMYNRSQNNFLYSYLSITNTNVKKDILSLFEVYKKNIADFIITSNQGDHPIKSNLSKIAKDKIVLKESMTRSNKVINKYQIRLFPENYENELLKPVNKEYLSRVNTFDSLSFFNYISVDTKNILAFLISLFKIKEEEVNSALEHIVYILTVKSSLFTDHLDLLLNRLIIIYETFPQFYELINQGFSLISSNLEGKIYLKLINRYMNKSNPAIILNYLNLLYFIM